MFNSYRFLRTKSLNITPSKRKEEIAVKIITIKDAGKERKAVYFENLPSGEELKELVDILSGSNILSSELLTPSFPGSIPDVMGADYILLVTFNELPKDGNGIYGVSDWVSNTLDKAMPEGIGAALTQPALFTNRVVDTEESVWLVVISPMDRNKTKLTGAFIADPHDDESPSLIYTE